MLMAIGNDWVWVMAEGMKALWIRMSVHNAIMRVIVHYAHGLLHCCSTQFCSCTKTVLISKPQPNNKYIHTVGTQPINKYKQFNDFQSTHHSNPIHPPLRHRHHHCSILTNHCHHTFVHVHYTVPSISSFLSAFSSPI